MDITITAKDLKKHNISNSESGQVIDELAYACNRWTSDELWENNLEYEPNTPYDFNYEEDLFEHTKTEEQFTKLYMDLVDNTKPAMIQGESKELQAGAFVALTYPKQWALLLEAYKDTLEEDRTEGISEEYNKQLQKEIESYDEDQYKEWLHGDHRDYNGVVYDIAKYFTEEREGSYNRERDEYTFTIGKSDMENMKEGGYRKNEYKNCLLDSIRNSSESRVIKDREEREKRKEERKKIQDWKEKCAIAEAESRKKKLQAMKL